MYEKKYSYANSRFLEYVKTNDAIDDPSLTGKSIGTAVYDELPFNWKYSAKNQNKEYKLPKTSFIIGYDLVTTYYVLKNRLSCKDYFAKKAVIDTLDYIVEHAPVEKLLLFLLANARIMGITLPNTRNHYGMDNDIIEINERIDKLYPIIKRYLNILDDTVYVNHPKYILNEGKAYVKEYF